MPLKDSYVIWNNKGGVGKTTLTFHLATHYAMRNPDRKVLVIDLCPQANVSMALLGSSGRPTRDTAKRDHFVQREENDQLLPSESYQTSLNSRTSGFPNTRERLQ